MIMSNNPRGPKKRFSAPIVTFLIIVVVGIFYMAWNYYSGNLPWQQPHEDGEPQITWLEKEAEEKIKDLSKQDKEYEKTIEDLNWAIACIEVAKEGGK